MKKKTPRPPTLAHACRRIVRLERLLKAYEARLAFIEERAVLADQADVRMRKSFRR